MSSINNINAIPQSVAQYMLSFSSPADLASFIKTSRSMHTLAEHPIVWKQVARNLDAAIQPTESPKSAIRRKQAEIDELNQIFIRAMDFVKVPRISSEIEDMLGPAPDYLAPIPTGRDPFDSRQKIKQWCIDQTAENSYHAPFQPLPLLEKARRIVPGFINVPAEVNDPRVLALLKNAIS